MTDNRLFSAAFAIALLANIGQVAAEPAPESPAFFACVFTQGQSWSYDNGDFQSAAPAQLAFEIEKIDLEAQTAHLLVGGKSGATLRVIRALNANHFLEVANEGFLNLTTIYDADPAKGAHPAVHSRHFGLLGQPVFSQYIGMCTPKAAP